MRNTRGSKKIISGLAQITKVNIGEKMTEIASAKQEIEEKYKGKIEKWYQKQKKNQLIKIIFFFCFLCLSSFGQFAILENSFEVRFSLSNSDRIFGIESKALLSLLVTAALPLTTLIDESKILGKKIKISCGITFSPIIWIILPLDMLLTLQAVVAVSTDSNDYLIPVIAFAIAAIFSISAFYLSQAIVAAGRELMLTEKNLQILTVYGIDPIPLDKDADHIKLREDYEAARKEAEQANKELEQIVAATKNLESQKVQDQEQLKQLKSQEAEQIKKIQEFEQKLNSYKEYTDAIIQLKTKFNKVTKPIIDLIAKAQEFAGLDESIKDLSFPKLDITPDKNGKAVEIPTYYWRWQNSDSSWENLKLPSELSSVGRSLFNAMQQQKELPPPNVRNYAPREGLSKCLVFSFEPYGVIVYCRDEEYRKDVSKWDAQAESDFKGKLAEDQLQGYFPLEFTAQEIMQNQLVVLERIKDMIEAKSNGTGV